MSSAPGVRQRNECGVGGCRVSVERELVRMRVMMRRRETRPEQLYQFEGCRKHTVPTLKTRRVQLPVLPVPEKRVTSRQILLQGAIK